MLGREGNLNAHRYGDAGDWQILFRVKIDRAGEIETRALAILSDQHLARLFPKDGRDVLSKETLRCSARRAIDALKAAIGDLPRSDEWMSPYCDRYDLMPKKAGRGRGSLRDKRR
jgi:hypothetical protein